MNLKVKSINNKLTKIPILESSLSDLEELLQRSTCIEFELNLDSIPITFSFLRDGTTIKLGPVTFSVGPDIVSICDTRFTFFHPLHLQ